MFTKAFALFVFSVAVLGCGLTTQQSAKQTLAGIDQQEALIAAQHTLAEEGVDVEQLDFQTGELKSTWQKKNRQQIQYTVTVEGAGQATAGTVVVTVKAQSREKIVGGWSDPIPANNADLDDLLGDIVSLAVSRYEPGQTMIESTTVETPLPSTTTSSTPTFNCVTTTDCPAGSHCAGGKCASECDTNGDCETGKQCDGQGRCVDPADSVSPVSSSRPTEQPTLSLNAKKEGQL